MLSLGWLRSRGIYGIKMGEFCEQEKFSIVGGAGEVVSELARVHDAWHDDVVSSVSSAALVALIVSL